MLQVSCRGLRPVSHLRCISTTPEQTTRERLRLLLRDTAQPVAVITSNLSLSGVDKLKHHGATLSSFTSIALDPHPIVSFSLRIPSRMAAALKEASASLTSHMVVNILSASQQATAVRFSRPDLYPDPFKTTPYTLSEEGLPILEGSLGALSCKLLKGSWPLHDLDFIEGRSMEANVETKMDESLGGTALASELFLARVVRVESLLAEDDTRTLPLLYHRRVYATCSELPPIPQTKH
ncbi:hypothetical protein HWV62_19725 [Athelia sp. TMB]|nr:hypothetical protein HWV62_19725 [Athelia sp. TMB]